MDSFINALQWPAMAITLLSAWLVASQSQRKRSIGFWSFIASNLLWVVWGWHAEAFAVLGLQVALATLNVLGVRKTESKTQGPTHQ